VQSSEHGAFYLLLCCLSLLIRSQNLCHLTQTWTCQAQCRLNCTYTDMDLAPLFPHWKSVLGRRRPQNQDIRHSRRIFYSTSETRPTASLIFTPTSDTLSTVLSFNTFRSYVQNDTGKFAASVAKKREQSTLFLPISLLFLLITSGYSSPLAQTTPETPLCAPKIINYPLKCDPSGIPAHTGYLELKKCLTYTYTKGYFVITLTGFLPRQIPTSTLPEIPSARKRSRPVPSGSFVR